jgi:hypothetical protein
MEKRRFYPGYFPPLVASFINTGASARWEKARMTIAVSTASPQHVKAAEAAPNALRLRTPG